MFTLTWHQEIVKNASGQYEVKNFSDTSGFTGTEDSPGNGRW